MSQDESQVDRSTLPVGDHLLYSSTSSLPAMSSSPVLHHQQHQQHQLEQASHQLELLLKQSQLIIENQKRLVSEQTLANLNSTITNNANNANNTNIKRVTIDENDNNNNNNNNYNSNNHPNTVLLPSSHKNTANAENDKWSDSEDPMSHHSDGYDRSIINNIDDDMQVADKDDTDSGTSSQDESDDGRESEIEMDQLHSDYFHMEEEEEQKKKKRLLRYKYYYSKLDFIMENCNILLSVSSVGIFISMSYVDPNSTSWHTLNSIMLSLSIFFVIDFVRCFIFTKNKSKFFKKGNTILDIVTLLPIFITLLPNDLVNVIPLGFLRVLRILKAPRIFKIIGVSTVFQKTSQLLLSLIIFIVLFASMITSVEGIKFHNAIYYAVVTLSTVGYGDISPQTSLGRALTSVIILTALIYLPLKSSQLLTLLAETKPWDGYYKTNKKKFVAVVGNIYEKSLNVFMREYFFNSRIKLMPLLVFSNQDPPEFYNPLTLANKVKKFCIYIKGSPGKDSDFVRSNLPKASSIFIFSKQSTTDLEDDKDNILRVMSIRSFLPRVPIFVQVLNHRLIPKMISAGATQVISIQEMKMNLIAQSCLAPGFSTLVMNLLRSDLRRYDEVDEYGSGNSYEIFTTKFSSVFVGLPFKYVANVIYEKMGMIIFGIESVINKKQRIKVNPNKDYSIRDLDCAILLAKNKVAAKRVKFTPTNFMNERNNHIEEKMMEANVAWKYDPESKMYRCKLIISERKDVTAINNRKSLHKLIIEKKKEMKHDMSVLETVHRGEPSPKSASEVFGHYSNNSNNSNNSHKSGPHDGASGSSLSPHPPSPLESTLPPKDSSTPTLSELSTLAEISPTTSDYNLSSTMSVPMPPKLLNASKIPKRFWTSHFLEDYLVLTVEDNESIQNHIIIAGHVLYIESFIRPLREPYLRRYDPIVILTPKFPVEEWDSINKYPEIYIVEGTPASQKDLKRAGINKCSKLIILSLESHNREPFLNDKDTLLTIVSAKDMLKSNRIFPIFELSDPLNLHLLPNNNNWNQNDPYYLAPSFACGSVFLSTVFDSLLCQCFFNPHLLALIQILVGKSDSLQKTKIFQVDLPTEFIGQRFGYLFEILLGCNVICMGLFRKKADGGRFVHTNPSSSTIMRESDKLFILHRVKIETKTY